MSAALLDPWADAAAIARHLNAPDARLAVLLGAEGWCQKCRDIRPEFERIAQRNDDPRTMWLWLDLDEHAEFIGGFIPDDLPLLLLYRGDVLQLAQPLADASIAALIANAPGRPLPPPDSDPGIRQRLMRLDWAIG